MRNFQVANALEAFGACVNVRFLRIHVANWFCKVAALVFGRLLIQSFAAVFAFAVQNKSKLKSTQPSLMFQKGDKNGERETRSRMGLNRAFH